MKTIVLAAGLSTRLYPLTKEIPKPMLDVGGRPMMEHVINNLVSNGYKDIIITLHYKPSVIVNYFGNGHSFGANIEYSYEKRLLGTAGSIMHLRDKLDSDFLICSGSYYPESLNFVEFEKTHFTCGGIGTIALFNAISEKELYSFGQAIVGMEKSIDRFEEKPQYPFSHLVHSTYQIYSPRVLEFIQDKGYCSLPEDVIPLLVKEKKLYGFVFSGKLLRVSTMDAYKMAKEFFE